LRHSAPKSPPGDQYCNLRQPSDAQPGSGNAVHGAEYFATSQGDAGGCGADAFSGDYPSDTGEV